MYVAVHHLTAQESIVLCGRYLASRYAFKRAVSGAVCTDGTEDFVPDKLLVWPAREPLLDVHEQAEVEAGVRVVPVLSQRDIIDAPHHGVICGLSGKDTPGDFRGKAVAAAGGYDIGPHSGGIVAVGVACHTNAVAGIAAAGEQFAGI